MFPRDFPDTAAGAKEAAQDAARAAADAAKAVKARRLPPEADWRRLPNGEAPVGQTGLLGGGWLVARSRPALERLLPAALPLAEPAPSTSSGRQSANLAAAAVSAAVPTEEGAPPATCGTPQAAAGGSGGDGSGRCVVRVRLRMCGRGSAPRGAAVHLSGPAAAPSEEQLLPCSSGAAPRQQQHPGQAAAGPPAGARLIGFVTGALPRGACNGAGATALCCAASLLG